MVLGWSHGIGWIILCLLILRGALRGLVAEITANASLVVIRTHPGSAPAIARSIDLAEIPEVLGTIFDPLVRGASADLAQRRRPGSIGLGLYIAREVVTRARRCDSRGSRSASRPRSSSAAARCSPPRR
mgnify:CR=1 FL=1